MNVTLFVYGTLGPGEPAWPLLEPHARAVRAAAVPGRLYDTGAGYPAAVFGAETGLVRTQRSHGRRSEGAIEVVHGWCVDVDEARVAEIDRFEGDDYERITVETTEGAPVQAYAWRAPLTTCTLIPGGRWPIE